MAFALRLLRRWWRATGLFAVNVFVAGSLFRVEYIAQMGSVEGSFIALARYIRDNWRDLDWFPLWFSGMPFANTYAPLLHTLTALTAGLTDWSPGLAYHFVTALCYCLGPVTLYLLAVHLTGRRGASLGGALAYSLLSPSAFLIDGVRADLGGLLYARRFQCLTVYGEGPHILALTLIPLAILCLDLAYERRRAIYYLGAVAAPMAVALTNWPGTIGMCLAVIAWIAAKPNDGIGSAAALAGSAGAAGYLVACPWIPPSAVWVALTNAQRAGGAYGFGGYHLLWLAGMVASLVSLRWALARFAWTGAARFSLLFTVLTGVIVTGAEYGYNLFPQPKRFHLEMEMALCLLGACALAAVRWRVAVVAMLVILAAVQANTYREYARTLTRPIDITRTVEYRAAMWLDRNLGDARVFAPGSISLWMNIFTDVPQLEGCCDQSSSNWQNRVAAYTIYSGAGAGENDVYYSILWLKAFGVGAVGTGGAKSLEYYHPFRNARKFDGVLKEIWREGDDVFFEVPGRGSGLAHVIRERDVVRRTPLHGLDVEPLLSYVAALDDPELPRARMIWKNRHEAEIKGRLSRGQLISVQVTYVNGWRTEVNGEARSVVGDGIGMMVIRPECEGLCTITLSYDGGLERRAARWISLVSGLGLAVLFVFSRRGFWKDRDGGGTAC
ncbi:MAG: hypothetical protein ACKV2U_13145 [Bryobacteraceae bacterium]